MLNRIDDGKAYYRILNTQGLLYETVYLNQRLRRNPEERIHRLCLNRIEDEQVRRCLTLDDAWKAALLWNPAFAPVVGANRAQREVYSGRIRR